MPFNGAASVASRPPADLLAELPIDQPRYLYSVTEATTFLRTPAPGPREIPGMDLVWHRTIPMLGRGGCDVRLGSNRHLGRAQDVCLDERGRFAHTYVIGQTGTGKSTLLQNMILEDIRRGRGVWVVDPHGALVQAVMERLPEERIEDCVLVDLLDTDHPMPLNLLAIAEEDPVRYTTCRDMILDDLHAYLDATYDMKVAGGPMFETYFRGTFRILMGNRRPSAPPYPSLLQIKRLLSDPRSLAREAERRCPGDQDTADFVRMATEARGEASLSSIAPYIASKFERFLTSADLRRMTCQEHFLDIPALVAARKIVLLHLGRGRFGEQASGLVSSMVVSRLRQAVMQRDPTDESIPPCYLYVDEFQTVANARFSDMLSECRKYKLAMSLAHQYAGQLPPPILSSVLGNVGTLIALRVGAEDAQFLERAFQPGVSLRDLVSQPIYQAIVRRTSQQVEPAFTVALDPGTAARSTRNVARIRRHSRSTYARSIAEVETQLARQYVQ
jgi:hypothetical protein